MPINLLRCYIPRHAMEGCLSSRPFPLFIILRHTLIAQQRGCREESDCITTSKILASKIVAEHFARVDFSFKSKILLEMFRVVKFPEYLDIIDGAGFWSGLGPAQMSQHQSQVRIQSPIYTAPSWLPYQ